MSGGCRGLRQPVSRAARGTAFPGAEETRKLHGNPALCHSGGLLTGLQESHNRHKLLRAHAYSELTRIPLTSP